MGKSKRTADRCTGACCEHLTVPFAPDELMAAYDRWRSGGDPGLRMNGARSMPSYQDIHLIAPMLEHLGFMPNPARRVNPSDDDLLGRDPQKYHFYRCKHFNAKAKLCTIYEIRPAMCREYPYGEPCKYDACTWEEKKEKKQTPKERRERLRILKESEVRASDPGGGEKQYAAKSELAEKIGELNGKQKAELAELLGLGPKKRKRGLGRGMAALLPQKAKGR